MRRSGGKVSMICLCHTEHAKIQSAALLFSKSGVFPEM